MNDDCCPFEHKALPAEVRALVTTTSQGGHMGNFDENSMAKARIALNDLVEKSWVELDDKIIECKEYQEMNRGTFDQVVTDISRLVEQITDLERVETESLEGIAKMEMEIKGVEAELSKETKIYNYNFAKNNDELTRRQNDLDVFQFILQPSWRRTVPPRRKEEWAGVCKTRSEEILALADTIKILNDDDALEDFAWFQRQLQLRKRPSGSESLVLRSFK